MPEPGRAPRVVTRGFAVVLAVAAGALGLVVGLLLALGYTALTADDADNAASPSAPTMLACAAPWSW
jgi:hypothetical protein